jgi:HJR/Mrr/RecB family endonuclease
MAPHTSKPPLTGAAHTCPFEKLSPADFERLGVWLVKREGYALVEHPGEAGNEQGRDLVAWKDGQRVLGRSAAEVEAAMRLLKQEAGLRPLI